MTMDYKSIFDKAMSWKLSEYTFSENKVLRNIEERAKNMKKNDNVKQMHFTEITPEYTQLKKSHKVLNVFAGVAGTAAVLAGAVFGLNWLNEHGGLKEGGSDEIRAGYHEETTAAATMQEKTVVTEKPEDEETVKNEYSFTCAPSQIDPDHYAETDLTFDFDDVSAHISGYNYDGLVLKVKYELTYKDDDIVNDPIPTFPNFYDRALMDLWNHSDMGLGGRYISRNENVIEMESECLNLSAQDSFDTILVNTREFWDNNKDLPAEEMNTEFAKLAETHDKDFTAYRTVPDIPVIVRDLAEEMPTFEFSDGTTVHPTKLYLSTYGVFVYFDWIDAAAWQKILPNMQPARITLTMSDGSEVTIRSENKHGTRHDGNMSGRDYVGGLFDEPIDTRNVISVNILDEPFVTFEREADINCFQSFYIPPEEDRMPLTDAHVDTEKCDINVNWLAFDGMTLVLQYDVTFKNGLPADGSVVPIWAFGDNTDKPYTTHGSRVDKLDVNGDTVSYIGEIVYNRVIFDEPIKIYFMDDHTWASEVFIPFDEKNTGIIVFTPEELPGIRTSTYNIGKEVTLLSGKKINVESVTLGDYSVMITYDCETVVGFDTNDTYLVMNDGNIIDLDSLENKGGTLVENSQNIYHFILSEKLNIAQVKEIYVCGECVYGDTEPIPTMQQEELPVETTADDIEAETTE